MKTRLSLLLFISLLLGMTSCATIFNKRDTTIKIRSEVPVSIMISEDTIAENVLACDLKVLRERAVLELHFETDSLSREVSLTSKISPTYYLNFIGLVYSWPLAIFDSYSKKKNTYKSPLYLDAGLNVIQKKKGKDKTVTPLTYTYHKSILPVTSKVRKSTLSDTRKGDAYYIFTWLPAYNFNYHPDGESRKGKGGVLLGINTGLDYYYTNRMFLDFTVGAAIPIAFEQFDGTRTSQWTLYAALSNNHRIGNFTLGYGASISRNGWRFQDFDNNQPDRTKVNTALGGIFDIRYYIHKKAYVQGIYRPSYWRINAAYGKTHRYEHFISLGLGISVNLWRK